LQQVLEKLRQTEDRLRVRRHRLQLTVVLGEEGPEDVEGVFLLRAQVAERRYQAGEVLHGQDTAGWEQADGFVGRADYGDRGVWFAFEHIPDLPISKEELHTTLHHVLEDKVLIIITRLENIRIDQIIQRRFPLRGSLLGLLEIIEFFLAYFCVEDLLVDAGSKTGRDTTLCILD